MNAVYTMNILKELSNITSLYTFCRINLSYKVALMFKKHRGYNDYI
jgi:hypothetical protein